MSIVTHIWTLNTFSFAAEQESVSALKASQAVAIPFSQSFPNFQIQVLPQTDFTNKFEEASLTTNHFEESTAKVTKLAVRPIS
jgi:hypothetical protein